jgi:hypothetical protein
MCLRKFPRRVGKSAPGTRRAGAQEVETRSSSPKVQLAPARPVAWRARLSDDLIRVAEMMVVVVVAQPDTVLFLRR